MGHANPRSTAIYAHVQHDPSKRAANRVSRKIASALSGGKSEPSESRRHHLTDEVLIHKLMEMLKFGGKEANQLRLQVVKLVEVD